MLISRVAVIASCFVFVCDATAQTPAPYPGTLTTLFPFTIRSKDGSTPVGGLVLGRDGNFYGTTSEGGDTGCNCGTIFRITTDGQLSTIYTFTARLSSEVTHARATMAQGGDGNFYGTAWGTGISAGIAFRVTPTGDYTAFGPLPGSFPSGLVLGRDGNFYGTTKGSGRGDGTFFRLTPAGEVTLLHEFSVRTDGVGSPSAVIQGQDGNFYGTAAPVGTTPSTVFRITTAGVVTILGDSTFAGLGHPTSGLVQADDGNFYGTASEGVFQITPLGSVSKVIRFSEKGLAFVSSSPNNDNSSALVLGGDGNLYGMNGISAPSLYQLSTSGDLKIIYRAPSALFVAPFIRDPEGSTPSVLAQGPDGLYGTMTLQGPVPGPGGTVFKVTFSGSGGAAPPPAPSSSTCQSATATGITAVDPNTSANLRDPLLGLKPWDKNVYQALADSSATVTGVAADGVTPVILLWRMPQGGKVTFSITDENNQPDAAGHLGTLGCVTGLASCAPASPNTYGADIQQLSDGSCMAFVRLTSPIDLVRPGNRDDEGYSRRPVQIEAALIASDGSTLSQSTAMFITRTPVVLLHGLWSESATWKWDLQGDGKFLWCAPNYLTTNAASFGINQGRVLEGIQCGLNLLRGYGIAGTQVDFIGHSMGGLLGRIYAGDFYKTTPLAYHRDDNLQKGDIHKLITLDTPHFGSGIANGLVDKDGLLTELGVKVQAAFDGAGANKCISCGAVFDLRVGSPAVSRMPAVDVPSHAIVSVGGAVALEAGLAIASELPLPIAALVVPFVLNEASDFFGSDAHDLIVTETSQAGGLSGAAVSRFEPGPRGLALHFTVTGENRISERVIELLNMPVNSPSFGRFQATGR